MKTAAERKILSVIQCKVGLLSPSMATLTNYSLPYNDSKVRSIHMTRNEEKNCDS
jgi:hypothetical protein